MLLNLAISTDRIFESRCISLLLNLTPYLLLSCSFLLSACLVFLTSPNEPVRAARMYQTILTVSSGNDLSSRTLHSLKVLAFIWITVVNITSQWMLQYIGFLK